MGSSFRSYDLAVEGHAGWPGQTRFAHLAVLSLANAGAVDLALEKFQAFGLGESTDQEARALLGRLKKDQGFATRGDGRLQFLAEARAIYEETYARALTEGRREAYLPGRERGVRWRCGPGDTSAARQLARAVLAEVELLLFTTDGSDRYWLQATSLEAKLLLGELDGGPDAGGGGAGRGRRDSMRRWRLPDGNCGGSPRAMGRWSRHSCTGLRHPRVMHYTGHIIAAKSRPGRFPAQEEARVAGEIEALLEAKGVGAGYGSLAAGADILFAEALLARGATLNVVLPFAVDDFLDQSVRSAGGEWVQRFHACLKAAKTVRYATEDGYMQHDSLFNYCSQLGMGLAVLAARHMQAPVLQGVGVGRRGPQRCGGNRAGHEGVAGRWAAAIHHPVRRPAPGWMT